MRDIFITMIVLGMLPVALLRPWVGALMWTWLSLMSPHRLTWGFAYDYPFVQLIAIVTMASWAINTNRHAFPINTITTVWMIFTLWLGITTLFALDQEAAFDRYIFVLKMFALAFFIVLTIGTREQIHALAWVTALAIGFFGVKGGVFGALTGASHRIYGPPGSFISDNNQMALAIIMVMPFMRYLQLNSANRLIRLGFLGALAFSFISVLASHSRGALLGVAAMLFFLIMKSRQKLLFAPMVVIGFVGALFLLPEHWHERMGTIQTYEEDRSAMERLEIWSFAIDVAVARPINGGGFDVFYYPPAYQLYGPDVRIRAVHSIIFQVLGEHGFVGLFLFLMLGLATWTTGGWVERRTRNIADLRWAYDLAAMTRVSLVGYFVAGLFLNLAFFDLIYVVMALMVVLARYVAKETAPVTQGRLRRTPEMPLGVRPQTAG